MDTSRVDGVISPEDRRNTRNRHAGAAMWMQPHLVILDEPTNYLDRESLGALADAIREFEGGVVIISHNNDFTTALCPETWVVEKDEDEVRSRRPVVWRRLRCASSPGMMEVAGFFFEFGAVRTATPRADFPAELPRRPRVDEERPRHEVRRPAGHHGGDRRLRQRHRDQGEEDA